MKTTTKIVGAVVGVLLVAALFTGAVAAAAYPQANDNAYNLGDKEVWVLYSLDDFMVDDTHVFNLPADILAAEWKDELGNPVKFEQDPNVTGTIEDATEAFYIDGDKAVDGVYYYTAPGFNAIVMINVKHFDAPTGYVVKKGAVSNKYPAVAGLSGATVDVDNFYIKATSPTSTIAWINPEGKLTTIDASALGITTKDDSGTTLVESNVYNPKGAYDLGVYTIASAAAKTNTYSSLAPAVIVGNAISFELYSLSDSKSLTALADEVLQNNLVTVELTAPYSIHDENASPKYVTGYLIGVENGSIPKGQAGVVTELASSDVSDSKFTSLNQDALAWVDVSLAGYADFVVKSESDENIKVTLYKYVIPASGTPYFTAEKTLTIKVVPGKISAEAVPAITNIGNEIDIAGTNELGGPLNLYMKGENYFKEIGTAYGAASTTAPVKIEKVAGLDKPINGKEFLVTLNTGVLKADAGYYTLYLAKLDPSVTDSQTILSPDDLALSANCAAYTTLSIKLVPSFISITEMPTYAVIGEDFVIKGTAEGKPDTVMWYVFGNNKFLTGTAAVEDADNSFEITIKPKEKEMEAGQYFLVVQHPMYDKVFNVGPMEDTNDNNLMKIFQNKKGDFKSGAAIFTIPDRQKTNAAYALCRAIEGDEDIDDMYVKRSFSVVDASSVINAIPNQVAQGDALVVSGVARGYKGAVSVTISAGGAFDATSKNDAGEATGSFAEVTTIGADGTWSVSFNTANIPVGEYKVTAKVGEANTSEAKDLKVVQGTTPKPTQTGAEPTTAPTTAPTQTPASPGFGILAALAGLGAVAVLLLRRQ